MIHASYTNIRLPVVQIEKLNEDFENLCDWFVDKKLSNHLGQDKTKTILFAS